MGHEISEEGIRQDPDKVKALEKLPTPTDVEEVRQVLGMFSYYRKFAELAEPLTRLTKKGEKFDWGPEQEHSFRTVMNELAKNPILSNFNHHDPVMLKTDASRRGIAGMLLQFQRNEWRIVTCCSRRLTSSETNYGITDLEGLALVYAVNKLRPERKVVNTELIRFNYH